MAIDFLRGFTTDHRNLSIHDYFNFTFDEMENDHQWIQWAFPIDTESPHNRECGLILKKVDPGHKLDTVIYRERLLRKYLESIGISLPCKYYSKITVDFDDFTEIIDHPCNHHVKRISRVLRHLVLFDQRELAQELLHAITKSVICRSPDIISSFTVAFWNGIVYDYVNIFHED